MKLEHWLNNKSNVELLLLEQCGRCLTAYLLIYLPLPPLPLPSQQQVQEQGINTAAFPCFFFFQ
jgi:hypothetical protein